MRNPAGSSGSRAKIGVTLPGGDGGGKGWWTQEGCVCQLGSGPGKGGEIEGRKKRGSKIKERKRRAQEETASEEKKKEKAGQVDRGGPCFCVAEGLPPKCQSNVHMTQAMTDHMAQYKVNLLCSWCILISTGIHFSQTSNHGRAATYKKIMLLFRLKKKKEQTKCYYRKTIYYF